MAVTRGAGDSAVKGRAAQAARARSALPSTAPPTAVRIIVLALLIAVALFLVRQIIKVVRAKYFSTFDYCPGRAWAKAKEYLEYLALIVTF